MRLKRAVARSVTFFLAGLWAQAAPAIAASAPVSFEGKTITHSDLIEPWWRNRHDGKIGRAIFA